MKIVSSEERFRSPVFWVTEERATGEDGFEVKRAVVRHSGSAVIFALDGKGRILLVRQFRLPAAESIWEIPAGRLDAGEKPLAAAKRELKEETGCKAGKWKKLIAFYPSPGYVAEKMTVFLATELEQGQAQPAEDERIEVKWVKPKDLDEWIREGKIEDGKTILAFLAWKRYEK